MTRMSPLWRRAPLRGLRSRGSGLLVLLCLVIASACAASGAVFADLVGQSSLATVLGDVPPGARLTDAPGLRLVSGQAPSGDSQQAYVEDVARIPGLTPATVTAVSVGAEIHSGEAYRPLVRTPAGDVRVRLAAVEDPAASLVVRQQAGGRGVWLPEPTATELGVAAGDVVSMLIATSYAGEVLPPGTPLPATVAVRVAGVYAVAADGRTPADPPGSTDWALRSGGIPSDSELSSLRARLVIADVPLAEQIAEATDDSLLWAVEAHLRPGLTLAEAQQTAAAIGRLRTEVRAPQEAPPGPLRIGVVSGIDTLVGQATSLAEASTTRATLLATTGTVAGLLALLALLVLTAVERRTELRHGAAVGVGPGPAAGLWALETALPAFVAAVLGLLLAVGVTSAVGPTGSMAASTWLPAAARAGLVGLVGVALAALVGAVGAALVTRPHAPRTRRVPWVALLVAVAAVAMFAAWSTPSPAPGPLGLAVPALVCAALGAVLALVTGRLLRMRARRSTALPGRPGRAGRWLAVRRVAQAGDEQVVTVAVMALGLGMVLFATSGAQATSAVVKDRAAVVAGARTTAMIEGAWALDPTMPRIPKAAEVEDGKPVPKAHTPKTPDGSAMVWRELITVPGTFGYHDLLTADPDQLEQVTSWGSGQGALVDAKAALQLLRDHDARGAISPIPVIAVGTSDLRVGDVIEVDAQFWNEQAKIVAVLPTFPGVRGRPMLVASDAAVLPTKARWDPRLAPPTENIPPRPYVETWIWSTGDAGSLTGELAGAGAPVKEVHTLEQAGTNPALVAARTTLPYQGALAVFLAFLAIVMAVVHGRRSRDRNRSSDVMLARSGLGSHGLATARRTELLLLVLTAIVAAVLAVLAVVPLGPLLLDLDRAAQPVFALRVTPLGVAALVVLGLAMIVAAWPRRQDARDEEVLRASA